MIEMSDFKHEENVFIADKLSELVYVTNTKKKTLAAITYVSYKTMLRMLRGESHFNDGRLERIADYFDKRPEYFLPESSLREIRAKEDMRLRDIDECKADFFNNLDSLNIEEREVEIVHMASELIAYSIRSGKDNSLY